MKAVSPLPSTTDDAHGDESSRSSVIDRTTLDQHGISGAEKGPV
jgi:hypothetical protein